VKILRIDHNEITEFTGDFPGLEILIDDNRDIHTIDISDSGLAHVPHWVLQHPHLKHLYLDNNYICNIACLNILTELETLGLSNNHILHVPDNLVHLKHVYADTNHMNRFNNFTQFEQVEHLNLSDNELTDAVCLAQFQKLKILELDHNQITRIEDIYMCHALQELYLHDNQLLDLPEELPPKLRDFTWYNNPFSKSIHF
jgi:Leucine-rich repeat (LRR) protein